MGLYDLRCALSGLSLSGPPDSRVAALLVGEVDGRVVPLLPPVGANYDGYGRVELWGDDAESAANAAWVSVVLELLWQAGALRSERPDALARSIARGEFGGGPGPYLAHVAASVHGGYRVWLGDTHARPCLYREDVADEIAADPDLAAAPPVRLPLLDDFAPPPPATAAALVRLARVQQWAARHGGLAPVGIDDGWRHYDEDFDRFAREAHARDPILRRLLDRWLRADIAAQDDWRAYHEPPREPPAPPFAPAMLEPVLRAGGTPPADIEALVAAVTAARDPAAVARILSAARPGSPASLAEFDGTVALRGDRILVRHHAHPELEDVFVAAGRPLRVRDGDRVAAGDRLTDGEVDPHDVLKIFGAVHVADHLGRTLGELLGLPAARAVALVLPMLRHARVRDTGERVTVERWAAWSEAGLLDGLVADAALTGYPALLAHAEPTLAAIQDARARRYQLASRLQDPERYYLPRDLADAARD